MEGVNSFWESVLKVEGWSDPRVSTGKHGADLKPSVLGRLHRANLCNRLLEENAGAPQPRL